MKRKIEVGIASAIAVLLLVFGIVGVKNYKQSHSIDKAAVSSTDETWTGKFTAPPDSTSESTQEASEAESADALSGITADVTAKVTNSNSNSTQSQSKATQGAVSSTYEYSYAGFTPTTVTITDSNWQTVLVNRHYALPNSYEPQLAHSVTTDSTSKMLDYRVAPHYNEMFQAAAKDGIYLTPVSGYRSYQLQKNNFENKINTYIGQGYDRTKATQMAAKIILPPGTSEHNAGLAMDIISLEQSFDTTAAYRWLSANAQDYGFILRYPKDKQDITEVIYEPWHWRYVGVETAKAIKASGLCLEEYLGKNS